MTDAEQIQHLKDALTRIATPNAFYVATSSVDPEAFARMYYAECILNGYALGAANDKTEFATRERYPFNRNSREDD